MKRPAKAALILAIGLLLTISAGGALSARASTNSGMDPAGAVSIPLYASVSNPAGWGWTANNISNSLTITVRQGDVVTFHLYSNDSLQHQLVIDLDNSHTLSTGDKNSSLFSSKTTATDFVFTASTAGTFAFFCGFHGYPAQHGTLVVTAAPPGTDNTLLIIGGVVVLVVVVAAAAALMMRRRKPRQPPQAPPQT